MKTLLIYAVAALFAFCASLESRADECGTESVRTRTVERLRREYSARISDLKVGGIATTQGRPHGDEREVYEVYFTFKLHTSDSEDRPMVHEVVGIDTYDDHCVHRNSQRLRVSPVTEERP